MILPNAFLGLLEATLNTHILPVHEAQVLLRKIRGEHIKIHITGIGVDVHVFTSEHGLRLNNASDTPADATLHGSPADLLAALHTRGFGEGVVIEGNPQAVHGLQKALLACDIDMEAIIAERMGDMPTQLLSQQAGQWARWFNRHRTTVDMAVKDYLQEEVQHTPTRVELNNFMDDVDTVRTHADRLLARLTLLSPPITDAPKAKE